MTDNDRLAELLEEAATHSDVASNWQKLIDAMLDSEVVGFEYTGDSQGVAGQPMLVSNQQGQQLWPVFSSIDAAKVAWDAFGGEQLGAQAVKYKCRDVWNEAVRRNMPTALNILSDYSKEFLVGEMGQHVDATPDSEFVRVDTSQELLIREPDDVPDALRQGLFEFVAGKPGVKRAYLAWVKYANDHEGYLLVMVTDTEQSVILEGFEEVMPMADGATVDLWVQPTEGA